jgi:hypothetical protein
MIQDSALKIVTRNIHKKNVTINLMSVDPCIIVYFTKKIQKDAVSVQQLHVQQTSTYAKPETASAVLGS